MGIVLIIAGFAVLLVLVVLYTNWDKKRRSAMVGGASTELGLEFVGKDTGVVRAYDFMVFRLNDAFTVKQLTSTGPFLTDVSEGSWEGAPLRTAQLDYTNGNKTYRYSIAIVDIDGSLPRCSVSSERLINKLSKRHGLEATSLGAERLQGRFEVREERAGVAADLLNNDLAAWLLANGQGYSFETHGGAVAAYKRSGKAAELGSLVAAAKGFGDRVMPARSG